MTRLMAPTGSKIVATLETIRGEALLHSVARDESGAVTLGYAGETRYDWEGQTTVQRPPAAGAKPETVYIDEAGQEWLESQLVAMPAWRIDAPPMPDAASHHAVRRFR